MAEETEVKTEETKTDAEQDEAAFKEGFEEEEKPLAVRQDEPTEQKVDGEQKPEEPAAPKYVQITEEDFQSLKAAAGKVASLEQQQSRVFGTMGNLRQQFDKLSAGAKVEISDEDFAELAEEFPELAGLTRKAFERVFKKIGVNGAEKPAEKPTGEAGSAAPDPDAIKKAVEEARRADELAALDDAHPGWRELVGGANDAENPFRKWLANQPKEYYDLINNTQSAAITSRAIDRFKASTAPNGAATAKPAAASSKPAEATAREDRLRSAIQPRGAGGAPSGSPQKTPHDEFREGFESG